MRRPTAYFENSDIVMIKKVTTVYVTVLGSNQLVQFMFGSFATG